MFLQCREPRKHVKSGRTLHKTAQGTIEYTSSTLPHGTTLRDELHFLARPHSTAPGPASQQVPGSFFAITATDSTHRTGEVSCLTRSDLMEAPDLSMAAVTLATTGHAAL